MEKLRIGNKELIKDINKAKVIDQIRNNGRISRTDIAKNTNLGQSTITKIIDQLERQGLVKEIGEGESNGGRKPIQLEFNDNYGYVIGIKVELGQVVLALRNLNIELIKKLIIKYPSGSEWQAVILEIKKGIKTLITKAKELEKKILGIGISVSGSVDITQGILLFSRMLEWERVPFKEILEAEFEIPVSVDNDVNTFAMAELFYGAGKTFDNFVCVSIGVGVGAGIVIDRQIYRGNFGGAGEFGHFIIQKDGDPCYCGRQGCLEMYTCDKFIIHRVKESLGKSGNQFSIFNTNSGEIVIEDILKAAYMGDCHALEAYREAGKNIGIGLSNIINILNPAVIILTGEGIKARAFIEEEINQYATKNYFSNLQNCPVIFSKLGEDGWEIGAATAAIINLFDAPIYNSTKSPLL